MRKAILSILLMVLLIAPISSAVPSSAYSYGDLSFNALNNPSYFGRFEDALLNPSSLSRRENDSAFYFTFLLSESWDTSIFREHQMLYGLQNYNTELRFSFVGSNLALTAYSSTYFANRELTQSGLYFDIYNRLGIDIDYSFSYSFFSFGMKIGGGGEMRRRDRRISGAFNAIENAYFGSFDNIDGSEFFDVGASIALNFDIFSLTYYIENIISYRGNNLYFGWSEILDSSTFAFSLRYPKFTGRGELNLFRPRLAYSISGNIAEETTVTINGEVEMQLLPTHSVHFAIAYREYNHRFFNFNGNNGVLMFACSLEGERYSFAIMCNVDTASFNRVYPAISVSLAR